MYNSGITAKELIESLKQEADISIVIPDSAWYRWLNALEQLIYTEFLNEYVVKHIDYTDEMAVSGISLAEHFPAEGFSAVQFDDIVRVFADDVELEPSGVHAAAVFPESNLYYTDFAGTLYVRPQFFPGEIRVIYRLRPLPKSEGSEDIVWIPPEFIELAASKLRGEAYKLANEDAQAAKWIADYNNHLESFKIWAAMKNKRYGG